MIFSHLLVCDSVQRCGSLRYVVEFAEPNHAYIYIPSEQIQVGTISVFLIFRCKYKRHDHETHAQSSENCFLNSREYFLFEATWKVNIANYVLAVFMPLAMYVLWVSKYCQGAKVLLWEMKTYIFAKCFILFIKRGCHANPLFKYWTNLGDTLGLRWSAFLWRKWMHPKTTCKETKPWKLLENNPNLV